MKFYNNFILNFIYKSLFYMAWYDVHEFESLFYHYCSMKKYNLRYSSSKNFVFFIFSRIQNPSLFLYRPTIYCIFINQALSHFKFSWSFESLEPFLRYTFYRKHTKVSITDFYEIWLKMFLKKYLTYIFFIDNHPCVV